LAPDCALTVAISVAFALLLVAPSQTSTLARSKTVGFVHDRKNAPSETDAVKPVGAAGGVESPAPTTVLSADQAERFPALSKARTRMV